MRLHTRNFFFALEPQWWLWPPKWWRRSLRIGLWHRDIAPGAKGRADSIPFRFEIACDLQLVPNLLWHRTIIRQQPHGIEFQDTICGIQSWPFRFAIHRA